MGKREDESWFRTKDGDDYRDMMSVRVSNSAQVRREESGFSDGEEAAAHRWYPRGRGTEGEPFSGLDGAGRRSKERRNPERSRDDVDDGVVLCCCGPRWGGRKAAAGSDVLRTKGRWEVDDDDEYYKPPVWKQIIQKVKAQTTRQLNSTSIGRGEWVNYDPQSYEKNFDNGLWRDTSRPKQHVDENDENDKLGLKERARHNALLQKFASSRSQKLADNEVQLIITSPAL